MSACRWSAARSRWETEIRPGVSAEPCGHEHWAVVGEQGPEMRTLPHAGKEGGAKWCAEGRHAVEPVDGLCPQHEHPTEEWD